MVVEKKLIEAFIIQYDEIICLQKKLLDCGLAETLLSILPIMENRKALEDLLNKSTNEYERLNKCLKSARDKVTKLFEKQEGNAHLKEFLDFAILLSISRDCDEDIDAESNSGDKNSLQEYRKSLENNNAGNEYESGVERQCDEIAANSSSKLSIGNEKETDASDENSGKRIQKPTPTPAKLFSREHTKTNESFYCTKCGKKLVNCPICNTQDNENVDEEKNKSPIVGLDKESNGTSQKIDDFSDKTPTEISKLCCKICGRKFSRSNTLRAHIRQVHLKEKPFECAECGKHFPRKQNLRLHIVTHNPKPRDFSKPVVRCDICGKTYSDNSGLQNHIRRVHRGERPFECTECYKRFFSSSHLKRHALMHGSQRPFKCSVCKVGFKTLTGQKRHERSIHERDAPLQCAHCDQRFSEKQNLRFHIYSKHLPESARQFKCTICKKSYVSKQKLTDHKLSHKSRRAFKCSMCNYYFKHRQSKVRHEQDAHGKGVRFRCEHCDKGYWRNALLIRHMREVHAE